MIYNEELLEYLTEYSKFEWIGEALREGNRIEVDTTDKRCIVISYKSWEEYTDMDSGFHSLYLQIDETASQKSYRFTLGLVIKGFRHKQLADDLAVHFGGIEIPLDDDQNILMDTLPKTECDNEKLLDTIHGTLDRIDQAARRYSSAM